jgi:hypothetical protein
VAVGSPEPPNKDVAHSDPLHSFSQECVPSEASFPGKQSRFLRQIISLLWRL